MNNPIYLDYNATTPIDVEVAAAMRPFFEEFFGNPSSTHVFGVEARKAVEIARREIASLINAHADEVIFTSGGTESNNYAIKGAVMARAPHGGHIITTAIEHPAVLEVCRFLEKQGHSLSIVPVDEYGIVDKDKLFAAVRPDTALISVMHANNETGSIQPVEEIGAFARERGILFHVDAAQSLGKIPVDVVAMNADLLSVAGHKLYAPKGIGALYVRRSVVLEKLMHGADHEQNRRAGTENVLEITGLGTACRIAKRDLEKHAAHYQQMRDLLHDLLQESPVEIKLNGHPEKRLPNTLNISFRNIEANTLLAALNDVAASAGAACHAESVDVSHVLEAMNVPVDFAMGSLRFSTGRGSTEENIRQAAKEILSELKKLAPQQEENDQPLVKSSDDIRLTQFTHGLGCACKLRPQALEQVLQNVQIPMINDKRVLVDAAEADDAAVYQISDDLALVETLDFFTPVVDDPYEFGAVAAANALSDIYAMGAKPLFALNIVGFPSNRLPLSVLERILQGASDKAAEAGIRVLGGHTVDDTEPKFGMCVTGSVHPDKIYRNSGLKIGDVLVLTKPIGTGVLSTAAKRGLLEEEDIRAITKLMSSLNKTAAEIITDFDVHACTDVTGFGLLGHMGEMLMASKVDADVYPSEEMFLGKAVEMANAGVIPGGTKDNRAFLGARLHFDTTLPEHIRYLLCDAQTSGGLLIGVPKSESAALMETLVAKGIFACQLAEITKKGNGQMYCHSL